MPSNGGDVPKTDAQREEDLIELVGDTIAARPGARA
jgi:hypothetical protein